MIKLFQSLPDGVRVNGKFYPCDFDYRNVLKMLDIMQREDIYPDARDTLCVRCVVRRNVKDVPAVYREVNDILFEKTPKGGGEKLTSFEQDAGMIRAAFRQVYGINLFTDRLTWFEFTELLQNLPDGNKYTEVIGIRARPMPEATRYNAKERQWLMEAKQRYSLHLSEAEAARKYQADVGGAFLGLMAMIKGSEKPNG